MKHNGWTNYATWRVNLEIFDDIDSDYWEEIIIDLEYNAYNLGQHLKSFTEELISGDCLRNRNNFNLAESYALAFINDVNWSEIANHILDMYKENYTYKIV